MVNWSKVNTCDIVHCRANNEGYELEGNITLQNKCHNFIILSCQQYNMNSSEFVLAVPISSNNTLSGKYKTLQSITKDDLEDGNIESSFVLCDKLVRLKKQAHTTNKDIVGKIKYQYLKKLLKMTASFVLFQNGERLDNPISGPCFICGHSP